VESAAAGNHREVLTDWIDNSLKNHVHAVPDASDQSGVPDAKWKPLPQISRKNTIPPNENHFPANTSEKRLNLTSRKPDVMAVLPGDEGGYTLDETEAVWQVKAKE